MDLLHVNIFYQYLVDFLLDLIMHFFPNPEPPIMNILYRLSRTYFNMISLFSNRFL